MGFSLARIQRAAAAALKKQGIDSKRDAEIAELRFQLAALQEENGLLRQELNDLKCRVDGTTPPV